MLSGVKHVMPRRSRNARWRAFTKRRSMCSQTAHRATTPGACMYRCASGKALYCAAMCALCFRNCNVHPEYCAQFTGGGVAVKVVVSRTYVSSFAISRGSKTLRPDLVGAVARGPKEANSTFNERCGAAKRSKSGQGFGGHVASAIRAASMRLGGRGRILRSNSCVRVGKVHLVVAIG